MFCDFCFFSSATLPSSCLGFYRVLSRSPSVGPSTGHIIGLIVPANSNLVSSGLGLRPERRFVVVSFLFLSFLFFFISFLFAFILVFFFGCTFVPWICSWYYFAVSDTGWYTTAPQHRSLVWWYCVHVTMA